MGGDQDDDGRKKPHCERPPPMTLIAQFQHTIARQVINLNLAIQKNSEQKQYFSF
jgi:hypothetical protein